MGSFNSIAVLPDGNYVLADGGWSDGAKATVGAVVWLDGEVGLSGTISAANALIGSTAGDAVGAAGVTALSNGNYVVASPNWSNGSTRAVGAVTWIDAKGTKSGVVASFNSLTGKTENDQVGLGGLEGYWMHGVYALSNGNYVVASPQWNNGLLAGAGAVTWCNGKTGRTGRVSTSNSLVGTSKNDHVGSHGVFALSNGNYVLASAYWQNGKGATTWADGTALLTGTISSANSLVGSTGGDFHDGVGEAAVVALSNGNYVVPIPFWSNQATDYGIGAAKWGNGSAGTSGVVSAADALTGDVGYEFVGTFVAAIGDGNYVAVSPGWTEAESGAWQAGAVRRSFGGIGIVGKNSRLNAFTGQQTLDGIGWGGVVVFVDGNYAILSPRWQDASGTCGGAVTLISASAKPSGSPQPYNSVTCAGSVSQSAVGYDPMRKRIAVGRPGQQSVSLLTLDQVFDDNLE
jgi:hypothetical protein